jgi:hypothetical protein
MGMDHGMRVTDYFPRIRQKAMVDVSKKIVLEGDEYFPAPTQLSLTNKIKPWMERSRKIDVPANDLGLDPLVKYADAAAHKIAMTGGYDPRTQKKIAGFLDEAAKHLGDVPDDKAEYFGKYINRVIGAEKPLVSPETAQAINAGTKYNFLRTIGGNVMSPIQNLTQGMLDLASTGSRAYISGIKDAVESFRNPNSELKKLLDLSGVIGDFNKADLDAIHKMTQGTFDKIVDKSGTLFKGAENVNRAVSFFSGVNQAKMMGAKTMEELLEAGRYNVTRNHFGMGPAFGSEAMSQFGARRLGTQFKSFTVNYGKRLGQMLKEDMSNAATVWQNEGASLLNKIKTEGFAAAKSSPEYYQFMAKMPTQSIKYWGLGAGLFGSDAMTMGLDKVIGEHVLGDKNALNVKGALPAMGFYMGNMIGLGVIPAEDFRNMMFFLPGPAASMVADAASVVASAITGQNWDFSPAQAGRAMTGQGTWPKTSEEVDFPSQASKVVRSLPAGVQIDRTLSAIRNYRNQDQDYTRQPETVGQYIGFEPMTEGNRALRKPEGFLGGEPSPATEAVRSFSGIQGPKAAKESKTNREIGSLEDAAKDIQFRASKHIAATGDVEAGQAMIEKFNKKYGTNLTLSPESIINAIIAGQLSPAERKAFTATRALRPRIMEMIEENEEDE